MEAAVNWAGPPGMVRVGDSSRVHCMSCKEGITDRTVDMTLGFCDGQLYMSTELGYGAQFLAQTLV